MSSSTVIQQHIPSIVRWNSFLILAVILLVCCSYTQSKPTDNDQLVEQQMLDSHYPNALIDGDSNLFERAAPRLGRASPRLGRASPRLGRASPRFGRASPRFGRASPRFGRRNAAFILSQLNHPAEYHHIDDDESSEDINDSESLIPERRAAPRIGRAIKLDEQHKSV